MPYITQGHRDEMDKEIENLVHILMKWSDGEAAEGTVNYAITKILRGLYPPTRYKNINSALGVLECVKQEYYRVGAGPYEDEKREQNGDVI